jgi:hypothetical protein
MVFKYISSFIYISVPGPRRKRSRCNNNTTMRMCVCVCVRENYNSNLRARRSSSCPSEAVQRGIFRKQYNNHLETFIEKEETTNVRTTTVFSRRQYKNIVLARTIT